jgi:hypothetical protein
MSVCFLTNFILELGCQEGASRNLARKNTRLVVTSARPPQPLHFLPQPNQFRFRGELSPTFFVSLAQQLRRQEE